MLFTQVLSKISNISISLSLFIIFIGCQASNPHRISELSFNKVSDTTRLLKQGDTLEIKFFTAEHLNEIQIIRRDGFISLPLIGEVFCMGMTVAELKNELTEKYRSELQQPQLSVILRSQDTVYISGEVRQPGIIAMPGQLTVMESIMAAGGFNAKFR